MDYLPTLSTVGFDRDLLTGLAIRIIPLLLVILLIANFANGKKDGRFPPIPPSTFLLGHLPSIIRENQNGTWHIFLAQWARKYGPIFGVKTGPIVDYYINSDALVKVITSEYFFNVSFTHQAARNYLINNPRKRQTDRHGSCQMRY